MNIHFLIPFQKVLESSSTMNNVYYPELEKLARKLNKTFEKKGAKYILKKQKELNEDTIQISIVIKQKSMVREIVQKENSF